MRCPAPYNHFKRKRKVVVSSLVQIPADGCCNSFTFPTPYQGYYMVTPYFTWPLHITVPQHTVVYGHNIQNKLYGHTISRCCKLYGQAIYQRFYMATTYDMIYTVTLQYIYQRFYMAITYDMIYTVTLYQRFYMATTSVAEPVQSFFDRLRLRLRLQVLLFHRLRLWLQLLFI